MSQSWGPNTSPQSGPPGWTPPTAAPQKKGAGCAKVGCLGVVAVVAVIAIAAVATNKSSPTTSGSTSNDSGSSAGAGGATVTQTTKAAAPAKPVTVLHLKGSGIKNTAQFTVGDNWTIAYTFDCNTFGQAGNFAVSDETGMPLVNELKLKGSGSSPQYTGGTHHLEINSECDWTLTVTNG